MNNKQDKTVDVSIENEEAVSRRTWKKPVVMRIDIKLTLNALNSGGDGGPFRSTV